jgi:hypothetical protein
MDLEFGDLWEIQGLAGEAHLRNFRHSSGSQLRLGQHEASLKLYAGFLAQDRVFLLKLVFRNQTN